jgi:hypothetical protein
LRNSTPNETLGWLALGGDELDIFSGGADATGEQI